MSDQKLPIEAQKAIKSFIEKEGELPMNQSKEQIEYSFNLFMGFCSEIKPFLSDDFLPDFLKETTRPLDHLNIPDNIGHRASS